MASMSELRAYKATNHALEMRLTRIRKEEAEAHRGWSESIGAYGTLEAWTDAIARSQETASALYYLQRIILEIESK